jgi:DNA-binding transcriptional regulator LsrR (DeoR family)
MVNSGHYQNNAERSFELARRHYEDGVSLKTIAGIDGISYRNISKLITDGRNKSWKISVSRELELPTNVSLNDELALALRNYIGFNRSVVIDCSPNPNARNDWYKSPDFSRQEKAALANDLLHLELAMGAAIHLAPKFRHFDRIGIASGRAITYTAFFLKNNPNRFPYLSTLMNLELFSLSGGQYDFRWSTGNNPHLDVLPLNLDANNAVSYLAQATRTVATKRYLVNWPISCSNPELRAQFPNHLKIEDCRLRLTLLGLGVLNTRHHYYSHPEGLEPINEELNQLKKFQEEDPTLFDSIGEICHYLFLLGRHKNAEKIREVIESLNKKIVSVNIQTIMNSIDTYMIAAGVQKLALLSMFTPEYASSIPISLARTTLITDSWTAQQIIAMGKKKLEKQTERKKKEEEKQVSK